MQTLTLPASRPPSDGDTESTCPSAHRLPRLEGELPRVSVVTGATGGIGGVVARRLAAEGHVVVLPGRSPERSERLCASIRAETRNDHVYWLPCDLSSLGDVRRAADELSEKLPRVDALVNNAGIFGARRELVDGLERHLVVNYLSAFLLTHRLLPSLRRARGRVVNVAGETARIGRIRLDDLNRERGFSVLGAYAQTKLALILFTGTLAARLRGTGVTVSSLTPGVAGTDHLAAAGGWLHWLWRLMPGPRRAGEAVVRRVLADPKPGAPYYLGPLRMFAPWSAYRPALREGLYERSASLVGLADEERL